MNIALTSFSFFDIFDSHKIKTILFCHYSGQNHWLWPEQLQRRLIIINNRCIVTSMHKIGIATKGRFRGGARGAMTPPPFFFLYLLSVFVTNNTNLSNGVWVRRPRLAICIQSVLLNFLDLPLATPSLHSCNMISLALRKRHLFCRLGIGFFFFVLSFFK